MLSIPTKCQLRIWRWGNPCPYYALAKVNQQKKGDAFDARWKFFPMKTCMKNHSHKLVVCGPCFRQSWYDTNPNNALLREILQNYHIFALFDPRKGGNLEDRLSTNPNHSCTWASGAVQNTIQKTEWKGVWSKSHHFVTSWWLNHPFEKICSWNWIISPGMGRNKTCLKQPR